MQKFELHVTKEKPRFSSLILIHSALCVFWPSCFSWTIQIFLSSLVSSEVKGTPEHNYLLMDKHLKTVNLFWLMSFSICDRRGLFCKPTPLKYFVRALFFGCLFLSAVPFFSGALSASKHHLRRARSVFIALHSIQMWKPSNQLGWHWHVRSEAGFERQISLHDSASRRTDCTSKFCRLCLSPPPLVACSRCQPRKLRLTKNFCEGGCFIHMHVCVHTG